MRNLRDISIEFKNEYFYFFFHLKGNKIHNMQ